MNNLTKSTNDCQSRCTCIDFAGDNPACPEHGDWYPQSEQEAEVRWSVVYNQYRREWYGENIPFYGE
jgi:hypothetical protein